MLILAIETTGPAASVALADGAGPVRERLSDEGMGHLKNLVPMISGLLAECGHTLGDVGCIAVSEGPGSFTGIRIGVATARALAQAAGLPAIGVPTLEAFAYSLPGYSGLVCPIFDARRGQVYSGLYSAGAPETLIAGAAREAEGLFGEIRGVAWETRPERDLLFFGDGAAMCAGMIESVGACCGIAARVAPPEALMQRASSVARMAADMLKAGKAKGFSELLPVYMRMAEAERRLAEAKGV
ncbi:MAG: tRNA (adenosine(37)-N6)-threonylcarbamoyltransferase complex dimerization subunit type 1 TsaB [Clostridiales Family XIII bacterium]|jgi:tRNA threonylcarbamoyladenosine biosynthesis protein TsaB|nr:tRNA (adenosine(37)-N6)-threonylcarbamoyltransferase complex dimerization subunit type 1 TsaB [Clostridiales Family XIII bacterium]